MFPRCFRLCPFATLTKRLEVVPKLPRRTFSTSNDKWTQLEARLKAFMQKEVMPAEKEVMDHMFSTDRWTVCSVIETLKTKAKEQGLWNMWIPLEIDHKAQLGHGLTNEQYARLAEIMGAVPFASECFNCSAPDTGNMEVLIKYGNEAQKEEWLKPLLEGDSVRLP